MKNKNIICYLSERGHNNFWYPTKIKAIMQSTCEFEKLNWITGNSDSLKRLQAIKVLKSCILPINFDSCSVDNISPPQENNYTVVWVERHAIKMYTH
tara:strand:+ start:1084 stop:1374 length:291 start_codon:yes stop_codon:yes gene_type:complete